MKFRNSRFILSLVIFIFFVLWTLHLGKIHEPWRDEAQSWLIARDSGFLEFFAQLYYEGHPFGWFAILAPFAKLGFPYVTQAIIHASFVLGSAYLICFKSPFHLIFKVLLLSASTLFYETNAIARNYTPAIFFILLIATIYNERHGKHKLLYGVSLFMLINLTVYGTLVGCALIGADVVSKVITSVKNKEYKCLLDKGFILPISIGILGVTVASLTNVSTVFGSFSSIQPVDNSIFLASTHSTKTGITKLILDSFLDLTSFNLSRSTIAFLRYIHIPVPLVFSFLICLIFVLLPVFFTKNFEKRLYLVAGGILLFFSSISFLLIEKTIFGGRHASVISFGFIALYWIGLSGSKKMEFRHWPFTILMVYLIFSMGCRFKDSLQGYNYDRCEQYSGAKKTAQFLIDNNYDRDDVLIVSKVQHMTTAIIPFLKHIKQFRYEHGFRSFSYWQEICDPIHERARILDYERARILDYEKITNDELAKNPDKYSDVLIIVPKSESDVIIDCNRKYELLFYEDKDIHIGEVFYVYRFK